MRVSQNIRRAAKYVGWDGLMVLIALGVTLTVGILINNAIGRDLPAWLYFLIFLIPFVFMALRHVSLRRDEARSDDDWSARS